MVRQSLYQDFRYRRFFRQPKRYSHQGGHADKDEAGASQEKSGQEDQQFHNAFFSGLGK